MYIDNNNFLRYKYGYFKHGKKCYTNYLKGNILENIFTMDLTKNKKINLLRTISKYLDAYFDIPVFYTKLSNDQNFEHIIKNKYFKTFIGRKQLIQKLND